MVVISGPTWLTGVRVFRFEVPKKSFELHMAEEEVIVE